MTILPSGRLTASTIAEQSHANIYNLINNRTNVQDPVKPDDTGTTRSRKMVHVRFPDETARNFPGYPYVVVSRTRPAKRTASASLTKSMMDFDIFIGVYAQQGSHDSLGDPDASVQINEITDAIRTTLDSATNQKTLLDYGMGRIEYDVETEEDSDFEGRTKTMYISEFDLRFENNLTVTS